MNELRSRGSQEKQRTANITQPGLEEVEERLLGPVQVFDQYDSGLPGHEFLEEVDPRPAQPLARSKRVEV